MVRQPTMVQVWSRSAQTRLDGALEVVLWCGFRLTVRHLYSLSVARKFMRTSRRDRKSYLEVADEGLAIDQILDEQDTEKMKTEDELMR